MLELRNKDGIVKLVAENSQFQLPNGDVVSPAYAGWKSGEYELVEAPVMPTPEPEPYDPRVYMRLSFAQLMIGLVTEGWITEGDGHNWLVGILPPSVEATISLLPVENQFAARARATRPTEVLRLDPLVQMMAMAQGRSPAELDSFFETYAKV